MKKQLGFGKKTELLDHAKEVMQTGSELSVQRDLSLDIKFEINPNGVI